MPRGKTTKGKSNLSLVIPRRIHRQAKANFLRSGAPSLAAYVAWALSKAPTTLTAVDILELTFIEAALKDPLDIWL